ncbi:hypothetical protein C5F50_06790 [Nitrosopumilus ureiphilus]|uniref:Uncharacterized protein n=1 Tax=Nitrosopumilus ureiphilus TaxID=1470067 RepID=A0A7D5R1R8_9ARCH|nr:hypothetical protein C5F50_06790 [Nitrosopumilus ureiphilus]
MKIRIMCLENVSDDNILFNIFRLQSKNNEHKSVQILTKVLWKVIRFQPFSNNFFYILSKEEISN